jgi:hypothetical protein
MSIILDIEEMSPVPDLPQDERVAMTFAERTTWVSVVVTPATAIGYFAVVLPRLQDQPAAEVSWVAPMLWAIGASIVGTIVGTILISIAAGIANRGVLESKEDIRDKQINRYGDRITQAFIGIGAAGVLVLVMFEVAYVWIGSALFLLGSIGTMWGAIAKLRAYHGAFHG